MPLVPSTAGGVWLRTAAGGVSLCTGRRVGVYAVQRVIAACGPVQRGESGRFSGGYRRLAGVNRRAGFSAEYRSGRGAAPSHRAAREPGRFGQRVRRGR